MQSNFKDKRIHIVKENETLTSLSTEQKEKENEKVINIDFEKMLFTFVFSNSDLGLVILPQFWFLWLSIESHFGK